MKISPMSMRDQSVPFWTASGCGCRYGLVRRSGTGVVVIGRAWSRYGTPSRTAHSMSCSAP
ncbi:hypothetical protein [Actinomadura madurae]|uniref:hypothetical protein n=1 Tax=Actinomadura madurae TaxID=1993 RepID=UPI0020D25F2D|nr:hypothetical protein [Actinomadura madurae]MCQ0009398.1 hypothetical protein [Actinomadura madurae]